MLELPPLPPAASAGPPAVPPPVPPRAPTTARTPVAREGSGPAFVLGIAAVLFLVVAGAGVWYLFFREKPAPTLAQGQTQTTASSGATTGGPVQRPAEAPETPPASTVRRPVTPPGPEPAKAPVAPVPDVRSDGPPPQVHPDREPAAPEPAVPDRRPVPVVPEPAPAPPPSQAAPEPEPERTRPAVAADRTVESGLELAFRVKPPNAVVVVDGRVIGQAVEWSGLKGNRTYTLPDPGEHLIKITAQGMRDVRILVRSGERGGVTPIFADLKPQGASDSTEASDLRTIQVREGVGFRVTPPGATVLVDNQPVGRAGEFPGRPLQPRTWLKLPMGRHRVSIMAPGRQRQDVLVEVSPGAERDRDHIEVDLLPGG